MAWTIYQRPRYSRLRRIILINFPPPSEMIAVILTNIGLEAKYTHIFLSEETKKISKLFFTALITPKKRYNLHGRCNTKGSPKTKAASPQTSSPFLSNVSAKWNEIFVFSLLLLNVLITHLGTAQTHSRFTSSRILNQFKAEPLWQMFWSYTDIGWSLVSPLHIHIR